MTFLFSALILSSMARLRTTVKCQGWRFVAEGANWAHSRMAASFSSSTGRAS